MNDKRITVFCGHYGSGKTNVAVNYALDLKKRHENVSILDLDIVNPYFRTKDSAKKLSENGIELICSSFAASNLDIPALPSEMYAPFCREDNFSVMDIGGDDRGAVALGRFAPLIEKAKDYQMLFVVNFYRPLTQTPEEALEVMREIETACSLRFSGIVNNSNVGVQTTKEYIENTFPLVQKLCEISSLPLVMTTVRANLSSQFEDSKNVFPLTLQKNILGG
mgnify:FL=1